MEASDIIFSIMVEHSKKTIKTRLSISQEIITNIIKQIINEIKPKINRTI